MHLIHVTSLSQEGVERFSRLTEAQLRQGPGEGSFIAESPYVILRALDGGYEPEALLCEDRLLEGEAAQVVARCGDIPVYSGSRELLRELTGYPLTRGVQCAMKRPAPKSVGDVCSGATRVAVLDGILDSINIGAIFRSAAALGMDAVLLTERCCDPLNRRAVRVSMGTVFQVPWTWLPQGWTGLLSGMGFKTVAMALRDDSVSLDDKALAAEPRLAIVFGNEWEGLSDAVISAADYVVRIPMAHGVDSLNVASAATVAFWELRKR